VTWASWSKAVTSNAHRVRVDAFSNTIAMFLPVNWASLGAVGLGAFEVGR